MNRIRGVTAFFFATLMLPGMASADHGRDEARGRYGEACYEHKGKIKCHGHKGKSRHHNAPPPWAPAHGWRRKHDAEYGQYARNDGYYIESSRDTRVVVHEGVASVDVGIDRGTCNRETVGTVIGGVVGGVIGNNAGDRHNREITTILGAVIGGLVGHEIGRSMDEADQSCTGQVLEQAPDSHTVHWVDEANRGEYRVTPERTYEADGRYCRDYITEYQSESGIEREKSTACRNQDGAWQKMVM